MPYVCSILVILGSWSHDDNSMNNHNLGNGIGSCFFSQKHLLLFFLRPFLIYSENEETRNISIMFYVLKVFLNKDDICTCMGLNCLKHSDCSLLCPILRVPC